MSTPRTPPPIINVIRVFNDSLHHVSLIFLRNPASIRLMANFTPIITRPINPYGLVPEFFETPPLGPINPYGFASFA